MKAGLVARSDLPCHALYKELWLHEQAGGVVAMIDKNYDKIKQSDVTVASTYIDGLKYEVQPVSFINNINYDYLIVAIYNKSVADEAIEELQKMEYSKR